MVFKYLLILSVFLSSASCSTKKKEVKPSTQGKVGTERSHHVSNMDDDDDNTMTSLSSAYDQSSELSDKKHVPNKVYFAFDSSAVEPQGIETVKRNINSMEALSTEVGSKNLHVSISGHCDERGTAEYNMSLGKRRAAAVEKAFRNHGLSRDIKVTIATYGKSRPVDSAHNETAWQKNRRGEIVVTTSERADK